MRGRVRQSVGIAEFFASLAAGAIVTWVVWAAVDGPLAYASGTATNDQVVQSNEWFQILVDNLPILFLLIASAGGIAWAVFQTEFI